MQEDRDRLVEDNLRLVAYVVRRYYPKRTLIGDFDDMYQLGSIGLYKAAQTFDPERGRFSTYAVRCIRNEIGMAIRKALAERRGCDLDTVSLDELFGEETASLQNVIPDPNADVEQQFEAQERYKELVTLFDDPVLLETAAGQLTQMEAAELLGISQSQVSRKIKAIIEKHMKKEDPHGRDQHERESIDP